mmetsp:Transcript_162951/g.522526  ORF Transcript_162951/g.522526 Transcript_162951/m.522526 type:complete len:117 (-) Transcript_162951:81-431(-)|eukprot:CAMPEP_0203948090 /NCGR_PEP_ID=MMETSP0359-20131031/82856_1 /ASSEMBLY_ACC=CAM_ASM_000338 /TAXON_ID=268821 /ORGANISM="Scrippsiella Hangoei, Strain SHTV-5" /LENGTH=116 /DNA_ID=CAMNT_0050879581 /DNA_START=39 /DNA_END=389 /DNA_ORIENTATION=+
MAGTQKKMRTKSIGKDEALTGLFCNPGDIVTRCCGRSPMEMMESVNPPRAMLPAPLERGPGQRAAGPAGCRAVARLVVAQFFTATPSLLTNRIPHIRRVARVGALSKDVWVLVGML